MTEVASSFQEHNYHSIAATVRNMRPRSIPVTQYEDVITLLEWMQERCVEQHDANAKRAEELDRREQELLAREKDLAIRMRAVSAAAKVKTAASRLTLFTLRGK